MVKKNIPKVVVGLSGGVDSSVSLLLLKKQGYQPIGVSLKYSAWQSKKNKIQENSCCSKESFSIAKKVCQKLKVPYHIVDCRVDFKEKVIGYFIKLLKKKKTPSPCLICNRLVKFKELFTFAKMRGADYVATGHYARVKRNKGGAYELLRAKDKTKDQSYFLCLLTQKHLSKTIFPLGGYTKEEVYQIAKKEGFKFFEKKKQSQDLCFVSRQSMPHFLEEKIGFQLGEIIDKKGNILGRHQGLHFYTIGQRKKISLVGGPWWVIGYNKKKNQLIVTNNQNDPALSGKSVILSNCHFVSGFPPKKSINVKAKTRVGQKLAEAKLYPLQKKKIKLVFESSQKAITPGQWAVFYKDNVCLGGGLIEKSF